MRPFLAALLAAQLFAFSVALPAAEVFATPEGAIRGYDAVAYFTDGRAVAGSPSIHHDWRGARWHFASEEHRAAFAADPERYAPQYGGFCAYGTASGYQVSTSPEAFAIEGGKLYLNYNAAVQRSWNKDRPGYIATADGNWPKLRSEPYQSDEASTSR